MAKKSASSELGIHSHNGGNAQLERVKVGDNDVEEDQLREHHLRLISHQLQTVQNNLKAKHRFLRKVIKQSKYFMLSPGLKCVTNQFL